MDHDTTVQKKKEMSAAWFLFSLRGRVNRKQYWIFNLIVFLGALLLSLFTDFSDNIYELSKPQLMYMFWILWPSLAVQGKRWHDQDKSALWLLVNLIPIAGPLWSLIQNGFVPGTPGPNRYGPVPGEIQKENTQ